MSRQRKFRYQLLQLWSKVDYWSEYHQHPGGHFSYHVCTCRNFNLTIQDVLIVQLLVYSGDTIYIYFWSWVLEIQVLISVQIVWVPPLKFRLWISNRFLRCWIPASILDVDPEQGHLGGICLGVPTKTGGFVFRPVASGIQVWWHRVGCETWHCLETSWPMASTPAEDAYTRPGATCWNFWKSMKMAVNGEKWGFRYQLSTRCWQMWSWNCKLKGLGLIEMRREMPLQGLQGLVGWQLIVTFWHLRHHCQRIGIWSTAFMITFTSLGRTQVLSGDWTQQDGHKPWPKMFAFRPAVVSSSPRPSRPWLFLCQSEFNGTKKLRCSGRRSTTSLAFSVAKCTWRPQNECAAQK